MSVKRYFTECGYGCAHGSYEDPEGEWVDYNDHVAEVTRLKAEVERLRKAGDAMAETLKNGGIIISGYILADDWFKAKHLAAKEGKQS